MTGGDAMGAGADEMPLIRRATALDDAACARLLAPVYELEASHLVDEFTAFRARFTDFGDLDPGFVSLVACEKDGRIIGVIDATLRLFANGCAGAPVVFIEGVAVDADHRRRGIATRLVAALEDWATKCGIEHMASDALVENKVSHAWHASLGFDQAPAVTSFAKQLVGRNGDL